MKWNIYIIHEKYIIHERETLSKYIDKHVNFLDFFLHKFSYPFSC